MESYAALSTIDVLLVDPAEWDARQASDLLGDSANFRFVTDRVASVDDAVARIESSRPDAVLLGMAFADAAGQAAVGRLCEIDPSLPVIVLVGHLEDDTALEVLCLGAQDVIAKVDLNGTALRRMVRYAIARKQEERSLRLLRQQAEDASRAKSEFLANLSHELRTPLNAIMGFAEMIRCEMNGPVGVASYREYAGDIHEAGRYLLSMMNGLLDLSKIEAGRVTLSESVVDVSEVVASTCLLLQDSARQRGVTLLMEIAPELKPLQADREKLQQVLINLVSNAIKFTPDKGRVTVGAAHDPDGRLRLSVVDTGIGIAEEDIDKIWRPFGQIDNPAGDTGGGAGLGLPLAHHLVRLHGGQMSVSSKPGEGTSIAAMFPVERVVGIDDRPEVLQFKLPD